MKGSRIDCDAKQSPVGFLGMKAFLSPISYRQNSNFHDLLSVPKGSTFGNQGRSSDKPPGARLKGPERLINMGRPTNLLSNFTLLKLCRRRKNERLSQALILIKKTLPEYITSSYSPGNGYLGG